MILIDCNIIRTTNEMLKYTYILNTHIPLFNLQLTILYELYHTSPSWVLLITFCEICIF